MNKKVFFEPIWEMRGGAKIVIENPPTGYEFVLAQHTEDKMIYTVAVKWNITHMVLSKVVNLIIPDMLLKSWLQRWRKPPLGAILTYGYEHVVFRPEPWIIELENASLLVGSRPVHFKLFKPILERALSSSHCKKIICWSEAGRRTIVEGLNSAKFQNKVEVVYYTVPVKDFIKNYNETNKKIKILFVGSQAARPPFEMYGGVELLESYSLVRQRYDNVELIIRSGIPEYVKAKYGNMDGLRIIENIIPREVLEQEFQSADIGVLPYHSTTPHTILEMMSYELPVVGRKCWANPEYIQDGVTGLLVQPSEKISYYYKNTCHPNGASKKFREAIKVPDMNVVKELAEKLILLIENPELRKRFGQAARYEVEHGRFSTKFRDDKLKRIFDEATIGD